MYLYVVGFYVCPCPDLRPGVRVAPEEGGDFVERHCLLIVDPSLRASHDARHHRSLAGFPVATRKCLVVFIPGNRSAVRKRHLDIRGDPGNQRVQDGNTMAETCTVYHCFFLDVALASRYQFAGL